MTILGCLIRIRNFANRYVAVLVGAHCAAWLLFLTATPLDPEGGRAIVARRTQFEAALNGENGMDLISDAPSLIAGRSLSWVPLSQKPLALTAGPVVVFVQTQVIPQRYLQIGPTLAESYRIAAVSFGLSTALWMAIGASIARLRKRALP